MCKNELQEWRTLHFEKTFTGSGGTSIGQIIISPGTGNRFKFHYMSIVIGAVKAAADNLIANIVNSSGNVLARIGDKAAAAATEQITYGGNIGESSESNINLTTLKHPVKVLGTDGIDIQLQTVADNETFLIRGTLEVMGSDPTFTAVGGSIV